MKTIDTPMRYAVIHDMEDVNDFDVYIDGSFGAGFKTPGRHAASPYGSGWTLVTDVEGTQKLVGYGVAQFWDSFSTNSEISELRSIIKFFEGLEEHFPEMVTRKQSYRILCDNQTLIRIVTKAFVNSDTSRSAYHKYGKDYADLVYFSAKTNISFEWVKGHASNIFNRLADRMARQAYRNACSETPFTGITRYCFVTALVSKTMNLDEEIIQQMKSSLFVARKKLHATKIATGQQTQNEQWKNGNSIHVSGTVSTNDTDYHVGGSYTFDDGENVGTKVETFPKDEMDRAAGRLRIFQHAIFAYRTAEGTDLSKPVTIHTNVKALPPIVNALRKGITPNTSSSHHLTQEINNLRMLMEGMEVRAVHDEGSLITHLRNLSGEMTSRVARGEDMAAGSFQMRVELYKGKIMGSV